MKSLTLVPMAALAPRAAKDYSSSSSSYSWVVVAHWLSRCLGPEGRGFESHSSRHTWDLGLVFHLQLPVALRRVNSDAVSIAVVGSSSE